MKPVHLRLLQSNLLVVLLVVILPLRGLAHQGEDSPLHTEMEAINRSVRQLGRQIADAAQKSSSLQLIAEIEQHATKARTLTPPKAEKMSGEEKAKYVATFQKDLDALLKEMAAVKGAVASDKPDVAKVELQKIRQLKESSHKELGVETGPPGGNRKHGDQPPGSLPQGQ
jgi:hypothetical protein